MPVYSKVVSMLRQIDTAHTFIGGSRKDIISGWTFVNGERKQVFPSSEYYTEVYAKNTSGSYSETLSWGKYKIVISGGGGAGGAVGHSTTGIKINYANNGSNGQEITVYMEVLNGNTKTVSGIIGSGAAGSYVKSLRYPYQTSTWCNAIVGSVGTGYGSGSAGQKVTVFTTTQDKDTFAVCSGSGGGSSSLLIDGVLNSVAKGGNGGSASAKWTNSITMTGGVGANGGTTVGTGAAGGAGKTAYKGEVTSGAGSTGYIHIYKSSIYPN